MEFKSYKEKQNYYKQRSKDTTIFWVSKEPKSISDKRHIIIKGKTYKK